MEIFNVIICGSRDFNDYELLKQKCDIYLSNKIEKGFKIVVLSGCCKGADTLGEKYATEKGWEIKKFPANWDKYKKSAGYRRNRLMAEVGNACIAFYKEGSENKGTKMMVDIAIKGKLLVREVKIKK